jgi:ABC-type Zn uptake system ZnuABC Zn-binding protein ZnuA
MELSAPQGIQFYGLENPSTSLIGYLEGALKRKIEDQKLYAKGIDPKVLKEITASSGARLGGQLWADGLGGGDASTYTGMFRHNVNTVVEALK